MKQRQGTTQPCKQCGTAFYKNAKATEKFCSRPCFYESRRNDTTLSARVCKSCGILKPMHDFYTHRSRQCRACISKDHKERLKSDPIFAEKKRIRVRLWHKENPIRHRDSSLKKKYGIGVAEFERMLKEQDGKCAICHATTAGGNPGSAFHVDHCHKTGKVRGLLCNRCNTAMGKFSDDPALIRKAASYLEERGAGA